MKIFRFSKPYSHRLVVFGLCCILGPLSVAHSGQPAARVTDMHVCPMVTGLVPHVGGPILPPGVPTVLIGSLPSATVGTMAVCVGPPDVIVMGAPNVLIGGRPAARMGDMTAHGGTIVFGSFTVLIGTSGSSGAVSLGDNPAAEMVSLLEDRATFYSVLLDEAIDEDHEEDLNQEEAIRNAQASVYLVMGDIYEAFGDHVAASSEWARALAAIEPTASISETQFVLDTYTRALALNGRIAEAQQIATELDEGGWLDPEFLAFCGRHGLSCGDDGYDPDAFDYSLDGINSFLEHQADLYARLYEDEEANRFAQASTYIIMGEIYELFGEGAAAENEWARALTTIEPVASTSGLPWVRSTYAQALALNGQVAEAEFIIGELETIGEVDSGLSEFCLRYGLSCGGS